VAGEIEDLERKLLRLNIQYDGLPDDRVADKKKLEDEIRALRDQLDALRPPPGVTPEPLPPPRTVVDDAKDDIDVVRDIVTAKPPANPTAAGPPTAPPAVGSSDVEAEAVSFVLQSADEVSDPKLEADWERGAAAREAERRRHVADRARRAAEDDAAVHPAAEELASGTAAAVAAGPAAALGKDITTKKMIDESQKQGCVTPPKVLAGIGIGAAVVIAVILVVLNANGDDKSKAATTGSGGATNSAATPSGSGGSEDLSKFAGHYVLTTGFANLNGPLMFATDKAAYVTESLDAPTGSIDVAADGTITGGTLQLGKHSEKPGLKCDFSFNATAVTGSVALYSDVGAIGQTQWQGPLRTSTCADSSYDTGVLLSIGIVGNDLYVCGTSMTATLKTCQPPAPDPYAAFHKG